MILKELLETSALTEIKMSPKLLQAKAMHISGVKVGIEFELIVRDFGDDGKDVDPREVPDYDNDEFIDSNDFAAYSRHIKSFFRSDNSIFDINDALDKAEDDYQSWKDEQWKKYVEDNYSEWYEDNHPDETQTPEEASADNLNKFKDEHYESWFEDNDGSISNWANSTGVTHLSDFGVNYSLHWPHYTVETEFEPIGKGRRNFKEIAKSFGEAVHMKVEISRHYHGANTPENIYIVEPDSSLKPDEDQDFGLEFKSPPLSLSDAVTHIERVRTWAKSGNAYTNKSCGLHMNVSLPNYKIEHLDYIKLALFLGDEWVSNQFGRLGSTYAKSSIEDIKKKVAKSPELLPTAIDHIKKGLNFLASKLIHSGHTDKMTSINTKENRVEFRSPGNDWLSMDPELVLNTLMRIVVALDIAMTPTKEKREYSTKLYKLLAPHGDDSIKLFTMYNTQEINKSQLKIMWAKKILGKTQVTPDSAKELATKIIEPTLIPYQMLWTKKDGVIATFKAENYNHALDQAIEFSLKHGLHDDDWVLKDTSSSDDYYNNIYMLDKHNTRVLATFADDSFAKATPHAQQFAKDHNLEPNSWYLSRTPY